MTLPSHRRCRLVLIAPPGVDATTLELRFAEALAGGDIASVILPQYDLGETAFRDLAARLTPLVQNAGAAVMIAGDTRVAGRCAADGLHIDGSKSELADAVRRYQPKMLVGSGGAKARDAALELGELRPDYIFFGRFGYDNTPQPHPRNLALGTWWAEMIELPCIVLAGSDIASAVAVAATGCEFVAMSQAVLGDGAKPRDAVAEINALLDANAPRFEAA